MEALPDAMPRALVKPPKPEVSVSASLSLSARPSKDSITGCKIAILAADGMLGRSAVAVHAALVARGATPRIVAPRIGSVKTADGVVVVADASLENEPGFLFDALVLPDGADGVANLADDEHTVAFIQDQYRHGKSFLVLGASTTLLELAGVSPKLATGGMGPGMVISATDTAPTVDAFIKAVAHHRHHEREASV
jgi:catalase